MKHLPWLILTAALACGADLRLGIVGTDTSHAVAFTSLLNDPANKDHIAGARVVAAFKGGSPDLPESANRVEKYAAELQSKWGVEIVPDIKSICPKVDAVLLESVDGRAHLALAREVFECGKPVFIDKPLASSLEDARAISQLARQKGVKWFSASALRFSEGLPQLRINGMNGAIAWGPGPLEAHHQLDLSWYGIHTVELIYALLGPGCEEVTRSTSADADVVTGKWKDGRLGTIRVIRPYSKFGAVTFSTKEVMESDKELYTGYKGLLQAILQFVRTGQPPVAESETLEMFSFMEAAQRSKSSGGQPARLR
jgi:hypothetical protein